MNISTAAMGIIADETIADHLIEMAPLIYRSVTTSIATHSIFTAINTMARRLKPLYFVFDDIDVTIPERIKRAAVKGRATGTNQLMLLVKRLNRANIPSVLVSISIIIPMGRWFMNIRIVRLIQIHRIDVTG